MDGGRSVPLIFCVDLAVCCSVFLSSLVDKSDSDGFAQYRLNNCSVELDQQLLAQVELSEVTQKVYSLLVNVGLPLQVLRDCGSTANTVLLVGRTAI